MTFPELALLALPVVAWAGAGVGLSLAYRRSASPTVFRLAAIFLAGWAVFATTTLAWVLANGGWSAIVELLRSPGVIVEPRYGLLWIAGGLGAFVVFAVAFGLSQAVGRGFLLALRPRALPWPEALSGPTAPTSLLAFRAVPAEAFAFTLVERGPDGRPRRRDVILVSDGLLSQLAPEEQAAVIAHELGHLRELDGRYLTFFRTFARMMRWDPVLAYLSDRLTAREEFRADLDAVELTRRPRALARALFKATQMTPSPGSPLPGLLGIGGRRGRRQAVERIRRLVALAESGRFPEEPVA
ncbi:MAG TPA: M48 family metalloprotease [Thermoplasmata archaeon]|nr:M48 family metalloprotease [Thermoplasmata archaeon]